LAAVIKLLFSSFEDFLLVSSGPFDRISSTKTKQNYFKYLRTMRNLENRYHIPQTPKLSLALKDRSRYYTNGTTLKNFKFWINQRKGTAGYVNAGHWGAFWEPNYHNDFTKCAEHIGAHISDSGPLSHSLVPFEQ
jgi:hypothetical protein